jgi:hypothetical protein
LISFDSTRQFRFLESVQHLDFSIWISASGFLVSSSVFWYSQSLMICDPFDEPIGIKNPVADFQQQV